MAPLAAAGFLHLVVRIETHDATIDTYLVRVRCEHQEWRLPVTRGPVWIGWVRRGRNCIEVERAYLLLESVVRAWPIQQRCRRVGLSIVVNPRLP